MPQTLWQPPSDWTPPPSGSYAYFESDAGEGVGGGKRYVYDSDSTPITVMAEGAAASVRVAASDENWWGHIKGVQGAGSIQAGYYPNASAFYGYLAQTGAFEWNGPGTGCATLTGWFTVDSVSYTNGTLTGLDLRFAQHCNGAAAAFRGKLHYRLP